MPWPNRSSLTFMTLLFFTSLFTIILLAFHWLVKTGQRVVEIIQEVEAGERLWQRLASPLIGPDGLHGHPGARHVTG
jgi:hypothetical protein